MRRVWVALLLVLACGLSAQAQTTFYDWRMRSHATDCTALTDGKPADLCKELDSFRLFMCVPTSGDCSGSEWKEAKFVILDADIPADITRDTELAAHEADTTDVHGVADTSALLDSTAIGATVQAYDADLDDLADGTLTGSKVEVFTGDSGSGGAVGAVPAPEAGDAAASKFLNADGTWAVVSVSPTLEDVRVNGNVDDTATSSATAPTWGGADYRCRIYEDATLGPVIECFAVSGGTVLTFNTVIYDSDARQIILNNGGNRDVCSTQDDTGLLAFDPAVESCGVVTGIQSLTDNSANPADSGVLRVGNNVNAVCAEAATPGTDLCAKFNASDVLESTAPVQAPRFNVAGTTCISVSSDRLYHDTDCDGTKDAGEEFLDYPNITGLWFGCADEDGTGAETQYLGRIANVSTECLSADNVSRAKAFTPFAGSVYGLGCFTETAPGTGDSMVFTVRVNESDSNATCTIANTDVSCSAFTGSTAIAQGDVISVKEVTAGASPGATNEMTCEVFLRQ